MKSMPRLPLLVLILTLAFASGLRAQWSTEAYSLKPGWNAIWLPLDCGHAEIDTLLAAQAQVEEIWRWNPLGSTVQYVTAPTAPVAPDAEWAVWRRGDKDHSTLFKLTGNAAYLVKAGGNQATTLSLTGKPLLPRFNGQVTGLSFTGFPIDPAATAVQRRFSRLFSFDSVLKTTPRVFAYVGGPLSSAAPKNPAEITLFSQTTADRGTAYWVAAKHYTSYYGPVSLVAAADDVLDFGSGGVARTLRIRNVTDSAMNQSLTVTLKLAASAAPPVGQPALAGPVPLLTRGELDPQTLQYPYTPFAATTTASLAPGEEKEFTFYLDRGAMSGEAGKAYHSVLQISDSLRMTRIDVPVSAVSSSLAGLWVGELRAETVDQIIGSTSIPSDAASDGFSQRVIVHIDFAGQATLLQQAYVATDEESGVANVYTQTAFEGAIRPLRSPARVSSAFFPLGLATDGNGTAGRAGTVTFSVPLDYQASTNPFVHTYHPAHDNLNARFESMPLAQGVESYTVNRAITLAFDTAPAHVTNPEWGNTLLGGVYSETLTGLRATPIGVSGSFVLRRVSPASVLVTDAPSQINPAPSGSPSPSPAP